MAMADYSDCYHGQTALQQMSQDMENQSTQPSSITSRQSSADYDTNPRVCSNDKFSAKFEAPVKISDSQKYKLAAEQVYQDQRSSSSFMSKLNSWFAEAEETHQNAEYPERFAMLPQTVNDMSLEQHLEALSNQYAGHISNSEDEIKILDSQISMSVDSVDLPRESECDKISISFPASSFSSEYFKECLEITENEVCQSGLNFMQKLGKMMWHKSWDTAKIRIKYNNEPIFPVRTTMDYLWMLYEGSDARVKLINEHHDFNRQKSIDVYID
jgi:hypothetical protein